MPLPYKRLCATMYSKKYFLSKAWCCFFPCICITSKFQTLSEKFCMFVTKVNCHFDSNIFYFSGLWSADNLQTYEFSVECKKVSSAIMMVKIQIVSILKRILLKSTYQIKRKKRDKKCLVYYMVLRSQNLNRQG